ncbi:hypothetical protein cypCar_00047619 [Cyprinus carpio]|nr:hypothetical protein cypCar_00047619 [Cyprinus carpio]
MYGRDRRRGIVNKLLKHIVQREFKGCKHLSRKITEWAYGPVCSSLYDLASLDTYEKNSALEIIVYGSEIPNRLEMLNIEPFNRLIEEKWERFAKRMFLFNFIIYVIYLFILTAVAYHREEEKVLRNNQTLKPQFRYKNNSKGYLLLIGHIITTIGALYFLIKGLIDMLRKRPGFRSLFIDGYTDQLFFLQAVLFLACALLYIFGRDEYVACLVLCLALSWVNLLYFSRGSKNMGIYNVMIQNRAITTLDMEWILPHCLKTRLRCGEEKDLGDEQEPDRRWCFSVEEVNWNQWNRNLGVVTEDPGKCMPVPSSTKPQREPSRRGLLQTFSKRWTQRPQRRYVQELSPLAEASSSV